MNNVSHFNIVVRPLAWELLAKWTAIVVACGTKRTGCLESVAELAKSTQIWWVEVFSPFSAFLPAELSSVCVWYREGGSGGDNLIGVDRT